MKTYNFDQRINRRRFESIKWHRYDENVLPMWVADMDFQTPEAVVRSMRDRVAHGVFGYGRASRQLRELIVDRLRERYGWHISLQDVVFLSGVVPGLNLACRALASPGAGVLINTPIYPPILEVPSHAGLTNDEMELTRRSDGTYEIDFDLFERTISACTRVFVLCNPHNPVGRVYRRDELERMAEICLRHDMLICSDEIHCDLLLDDNTHTPIASLAPEVGRQTITFMAPSKTYNIAGLKCSFAIVENSELREKLKASRQGLMSGVNILGYTAAEAAYRDGQSWLEAVLGYLQTNRDLLLDYVDRGLPGINMGSPEGTYLAWLDCQGSSIPGDPYIFFLEHAKVALNDGTAFGQGGEGFVRMNFGCPRSLLTEGLGRMNRALMDLE